MEQTVTVIIPTWNRAQTLERAVESVLKQSYPVLEILVCDDGSDDNSKAIVSTIKLKDKRVKWIECGRNGRPAIPRNIGIQHSKGEWIAFLDSDDWWELTKLEEQMKQLSFHPLVFLSCTNAFRHLDDFSPTPFFEKVNVPELIHLNHLLQTNSVICSSVVVKKNLLNNLATFPEQGEFRAIEDYTLWLKLCCFSPILFVDKLLVNYTDSPTDSIRQDSLPEIIQRKYILEELFQWVSKPSIATRVSAKNINAIKKQRGYYFPSYLQRVINKIFS